MKRTEMRLEQLQEWFSQAKSQILVISPYMSPSTLSETLSEVSSEVDVTVICSWRTKELLFGSSKLETYELCQENGWSLRVDHDGKSRTIHLKAYVVDGQMAMLGSANMTGRGMKENIESLIPVSLESHPSLAEAIGESISESIPVDSEVYRKFSEHVSSLPEYEEQKVPLLTIIHGALETEILDEMPTEPSINDLLKLPSIRKAISKRGILFYKAKTVLKRKPPRTLGQGNINDITMNYLLRIIETDSRLDIQKRYGSNCLVWKVHQIINEEINRHLESYIGKPLREIGLDENLWDKETNGSSVRNFCLSKLPSEINTAISNLSTSNKSLRLREDGKPLNPSQIGPRIVITDSEANLLNLSPEQMLPDEELRNSLWFPSFCIFEAPSGTKMGDVLLLGFGFWESNYKFVQDMNEDLADDIRILAEQESPFYDNPFRKERDSKVIFTKIGDAKGNSHLPLGHPDRKMSRYLTQTTLTSIAQEILSHDH